MTRGERAHSARSWTGVNAIHGAAEVLARLNAYEPRRPVIDGLEYHEGLNAVFISGGVAGNVLPDECRVSVNYRFAPDRSEEEALAHMREVFDGFEIEVSDSAPAAMPGLSVPAAAAFVEAVGGTGQPQVRLDRRGPLQRPRHPRRQLRARRPAPRAPAGRVRPARARRRRSSEQLRTWLGGGQRMSAPAGEQVPAAPHGDAARPGRPRAPPTSGCSTPAGPTDWVHADPWRVLRIQSEFVEGFGALAELGPAISVFGSARTSRDDPAYALAEAIGRGLAEAGFAVITGGGPGVMEAANKGACEAGGVSRSASASSCPSSPASTSTSTSGSTSATSSRARRCS